jgi:hypothetical protein
MNGQYEKSLHTLELPAVLQMLAAQAVCETAKQNCLQLRPVSEKGMVRRRLAETTAAKQMMVLKGSPSFYGIKDVRHSLSRADLGGMLNTTELLAIAKVLTCTRNIRSYGEHDRGLAERTVLDNLFASLRPVNHLEQKITSSIIGEDEIADAASPELASIRRQIRAASARARDALQRIISSPSNQKALQESIITTRDGRYVVPVKAEYRGQIPGLVHDVSASGATLFVEPMASVKANNKDFAVFGEVHPTVAASYDIEQRVYVAEIKLDVLLGIEKRKTTYKSLPKFPAVERDFAMLCDKSLPVGELEQAIISGGSRLLERVELFDVYEGSQIPEGKKSVAFSVWLRSAEATLTDAQIEETSARIIKKLEAVGAELRK